MGTAGLGAMLLLLAFIPGWVYLRLVRRLHPSARTSSLDELLEVLAVGSATTGLAILAVVLVPHRLLPFTVDVVAWLQGGSSYLVGNTRTAAVTVIFVLGVALAIAYGTYRFQRRHQLAEFRPQGNVWAHAIGARPQGTVPWIGVRLLDGTLVEGLLHTISLDNIGDDRDIALGAPIRVTPATATVPRETHLDRVVVPGRQIEHIGVVHVTQRSSDDPT